MFCTSKALYIRHYDRPELSTAYSSVTWLSSMEKLVHHCKLFWQYWQTNNVYV